MVWAAFSAGGKANIAFTSSCMNSAEYIKVFKNNLLPFIRRNRRVKFCFQQDNAPIHSSNETKQWLTRNKINSMDWPACSPDLNPVENIWSFIVRKIYAQNKQYATVNELKNAITKAWDAIPQSIIKNYVVSMPNRIFDVITNKGSRINY